MLCLLVTLIVHTVTVSGLGVYTTAEGDSYSGNWEADKLTVNGLAIISYNDGSKFEGFIKEWSYTGRGKYTYPDGSVLAGDFVDNCPVGPLVLTDPNGHVWMGVAEQGFGWCEPVNHFYEMLETTQVRPKRHHKNILNEEELSPLKDSPTLKHSTTVEVSPTLKKGAPKANSSKK